MATDDVTAFQSGADSADDDPKDTAALEEERACTKRWLEKVKTARDFDKPIREAYARNRKYARGDDGQFDVSVPIAPAYIDVLNSFLFAKNPDVSVEPSASTTPPPKKELELKAEQDVKTQNDQQGQQLMQGLAPALGSLAANGALGNVISQVAPVITQAMANQNPQQAQQNQAKDIAAKQIAPYTQLRSDAKQIAQTMELVIAQLWKMADLKRQGLPFVRSALSIGVGWIKCTWQEPPRADHPLAANAPKTQEDNLAQLAQSQEELSETNDPEYAKADIAQQIQGIQAHVEPATARGLVIDFIAAEDIQVAPECGVLGNYKNAPWIAHRSFIPLCDAQAMFPKVEDKLKNAQLYFPKKKPSQNEGFGGNGNDVGAMANVDSKDADQYTTDNAGMDTDKGSVCAWEIWNKDDGVILTLVEGLKEYAKPTYTPDPATTRFYGFFLYPIGVVDGERHPVSLITRSYKLLDEYNRARSNWRTARNRAVPKMAFDSSELDPTEAEKLTLGTTQEMIGITLTSPEKKLRDVLQEVEYAEINEKLYDTGPIRAELETNWGIQEALSSSIHTAKTATEAEIQQTGTNSRTAYMRDGLDDVFTELANYTAQVALQKMSHDDVTRIAGPYSLWPEGLGIDDLDTLIEVNIRAGSSGKPNTAAKQAVWAAIVPQLNQMIDQVGALQQSPPEEIAKAKRELMAETFNRTGEHIDVDRFLPDPPSGDTPPPPQGPPPKPQDQALAGPQILAMTQVCDQVRTMMISPTTAIAVLTSCFPTIPVNTIEQMVGGIAQLPPSIPPTEAALKAQMAKSNDQTNGAELPTGGAPQAPNTGTVQ
jgi:hypothetical protein